MGNVTFAGVGAATSWAGSNTNSAVAVPSHALGDILLCFINTYSSSADPTLSAGWTLLGSETVSVYRSAVAWKVATSTSDTLSVTPNAVYAQAVCITMTGNADTSPISSGEWSVTSSTSPGTEQTHPTVTAAKDGSALLLFRANGGSPSVSFTSSVTAASSPAGVEVYDGPGTASVDMAVYARDGGFTGAQSFTTTSSFSQSLHMMWSILVHPTLSSPVDLGTGTATSVSGGSAALTVNKHYLLTGASSSLSSASAALDIEQHFVLSGDSASSSEVSATGRLFRNRKVSGAATSVSEAGDAPLKLGYTLFGDLTSVSGSSAVLKRMLGLSCEIISATSDSTARLTRQKRLSGSLGSTSTVASDVLRLNAFRASTAFSASDVANPEVALNRGLTGSSESLTETGSLDLVLTFELGGSSVSSSASSAALGAGTPLAATSTSASSTSGLITRQRYLLGDSTTVSVPSGYLTNAYALLSSVSSASTVYGSSLNRNRPAPYALYEFFIDWDRDNGLRISDFETDFDGWTPTNRLAISRDQSYSGESSLQISWTTSTTVNYTFTGLVPGDAYTFTAWVYVPSVNGQHVSLGVSGLATSAPSSVTDEWQKLSVSFTPTATSHTLEVKGSPSPANSRITYFDYAFVIGAYEDVTERTRIDSISWSYGRDQSRALNPISPAETSIVLDNQDGLLAPNNTASPVNKYLAPNRELLIRATFQGRTFDIFRGYLDDITIDPHVTEQDATFSAVDPLGAFTGGGQPSTQVWLGVRTGDAINHILDEIGWPANRRDIDPGATVISHFWADGQDASDVITDLVASEGPPAFATVNDAGYFIFRDRHHRILRTQSNEVQATFNPATIEPCFSPPAEINVGWKDIINSVTFTVNERSTIVTESDGTGEAPVVWSIEDTISIPAGGSRTFKVTAENPVLYFQAPNPKKNDYILVGGDVTFSLSRTTGLSCELTITAPNDAVALTGLAVRGYPVNTQDGVQVTVRNEDSVLRVGEKADTSNVDAPWANANDAQAIGDIITHMRGNRLPTMSITVKNGVATRLHQILDRRLSDLIHIVEPRSYTDHDFFIESIEHTIEQGGKLHTVKFGCEAVPSAIAPDPIVPGPPAFTFNDPSKGFDRGAFDPDTTQAGSGEAFILDSSKLDSTDGLGY